LNSSGSGWEPVAGPCVHGNGPLGSINDVEFLDQLSVLLASQERVCFMELVMVHLTTLSISQIIQRQMIV
jgi:hypothetical protein